MKRRYITLILTALLLLVCAVCCCACDSRQDIADGCIRIHIRANSDSDFDQSVKLRVRDAITRYLTEKLDGCRSKREAALILRSESDNLKDIADSVLEQYDLQYKASVSLNNEHFPERTYGEYTFPEGDYDALIVSLGSGEGHNWWCVAFPPLCFVPDSSGGEKIIYKSWIKETLDRLFSK